MAGANCCVKDCGTSRQSKGIDIFRLLSAHINNV